MSHIRIDKQKALKKWSPVLENMGVAGEDRLDWMSEYAEFHSINENAYVNASLAGMGTVTSPQPSTLAGTTIGTNWSNTGQAGSGDLGQNLLPVAMKIAAQTIGLDLVAVKPSPGPKLDLLYIDFQYDDVDATAERPTVFKFDHTANATPSYSSGSATADLTKKISNFLTTNGITQTSGGLYLNNTLNGAIPGRVYIGLTAGNTYNTPQVLAADPATVTGVVEFLGFSRIDGLPLFRAFKQAGTSTTVGQANYYANYLNTFSATKNTFDTSSAMTTQITNIYGITFSTATANISLVSALEDHIPGFVSNFNQGGKYPMDRQMDDNSYAGVIGPKVSTKSIAVGTIEVSSALRRTEIEDIKANTGMDIVQKMESILVNELSQTISKQIVSKVFEMGDLNRNSAPLATGTYSTNISNQTIFDLDTLYTQTQVGGETTHAVQRKLITKMVHASNYIATEGRVGPAQFAVTNGGLAAALMDIAGYTINPTKSKINGSGQLYPVGQIGDIQIYVDPYMKYNDNRIVIGRKNNPDQPGIIFVPYLMAQSISIISEATFAPRMLLRSRYAVAEVGWYPQKQYMTIKVSDAAGLLN